MQTKCLIYCRVSSDRQVNEGHGLESQERRCRNYAREKGYKVEVVFPDDGVSGGLFERPGMKKLITHLEVHKIENYVIIFDDLSRLARDVKVHLQLKSELVGRGAKLESPNFNFEDSPEGELIENVAAATSQYERQKNRRQVIQKMKARLESGFWPFCMPPGLKNFKDPIRGKILKPDGSPNAIVRKAAIEKFASGELRTQDEVKLFVDCELYKLGAKSNISHHGIQGILKNPLYFGMIEYDPWGIPLGKGQHDGLVDPSLYPIVLNKFAKKPIIKVRKDYSNDFPLRGLVRCSLCNGPVTGSWSTGRNGKQKYPKYDCKKLGCPMRWKTLHRDKMHDQLLDLMEGAKPAKGVTDLVLAVLGDVWAQHRTSFEAKRDLDQSLIYDIESEITSLKARIIKSKDEELIGVYENELKGKLSQKKELEEQQGLDRHYSDKEFGTASSLVFQTLENPVDMWKNPNWQNKRAIVLMYFEDKLTFDKENGFGTATLSRPIELMRDLSPRKIPHVEMGAVKPRMVRTTLKHLQA